MSDESVGGTERQWVCPECEHSESRHHAERKRPFCDECEFRFAVLIEMEPRGPGSEKVRD